MAISRCQLVLGLCLADEGKAVTELNGWSGIGAKANDNFACLVEEAHGFPAGQIDHKPKLSLL